jgi:hypothetical protein
LVAPSVWIAALDVSGVGVVDRLHQVVGSLDLSLQLSVQFGTLTIPTIIPCMPLATLITGFGWCLENALLGSNGRRRERQTAEKGEDAYAH